MSKVMMNMESLEQVNGGYVEDDLKKCAKNVGGAVVWAGGKVVDGIVCAGEGIVDGAKWTGGKIADGASWVGDKVSDGCTWFCNSIRSWFH